MSLDKLPTIEIRDTLFYRDYVDGGKVVRRDYIHTIMWDTVSTWIDLTWAKARYHTARYLMRGMGEGCPYCEHVVDLSNNKKMFPEVELEVTRK